MSVSPDWMPQFKQALIKRQHFLASPQTNIFRLIHSEGDGFPGLFVDVYDGFIRLEAHDPKWDNAWSDWVDALRLSLPQTKGITAVIRDKKGKAKKMKTLFGAIPELVVGKENGLRFTLRLNQSDALGTGIFSDMRLVRQRVQKEASGKKVLNLFAHAGAFGVAAVVGGANRVDHLDAARKCASWSALNMAINGIQPRKHRFLVEDAIKYLKKIARKGEIYDLIICDPPATAIAPGGKRWTTKDHLDFYATHLARALVPGGTFVFSTNDRSLSTHQIRDEMQHHLNGCGQPAKKIEVLPIDSDYPEKKNSSRLRTMRGVWVCLDD